MSESKLNWLVLAEVGNREWRSSPKTWRPNLLHKSNAKVVNRADGHNSDQVMYIFSGVPICLATDRNC